nr:Eukaryotic aspartyl protease [uncultured organism]
MAGDINGLFNPPAEYLADAQAYYVKCDAIPPQFGVTIGNQTFWVQPDDLVLRSQVDSETGLCLTSIQNGGEGPYILGIAFLQNVVAVFDVGAAEMRFAAHEYEA